MTKYNILIQQFQLHNTDPLRRCYNGCHYSYEMVPKPWEVIYYNVDKKSAERKLKYFVDLNNYAVESRGPNAKANFKIELAG